MVASLAPAVAASSGMAEDWIWRIGNGLFAVAHVGGGAWFYARWGTGWSDPGDPTPLRVVAPVVATALGALLLAQIAVAFGFWVEFGPFLYLSILLWGLVVGMVQFVVLLAGNLGDN